MRSIASPPSSAAIDPTCVVVATTGTPPSPEADGPLHAASAPAKHETSHGSLSDTESHVSYSIAKAADRVKSPAAPYTQRAPSPSGLLVVPAEGSWLTRSPV